MEIKLEKKENLNEVLKKYTYDLIKENEEEIIIEIDINYLDDLAKELNEGEYYQCQVTRFGKTEVKNIFFNWLSEDWEFVESYHAEIHQMKDEEIEEYNKDLKIEENKFEHEKYQEYREYIENWQKNFNEQYAYNNGNSREVKKILGNEPLSFAGFLKIN